MHDATPLSPSQRFCIIAIALLQGLLLLGLQSLAAMERWPVDGLVGISVSYTLAITVPLLIQLLIGLGRPRQIVASAAIAILVLGSMAAYLGWMLSPESSAAGERFRFVLAALLVMKISLAFVQTALEQGRARFPYERLFFHAWNNCITGLIALVFTGLFWALLVLCASLFKLIGLEFFARLFDSPYFSYPVTGLVVGYAVTLGRAHVEAVVTIRRILLTLFKGLLPLLALITVLFVAALPATGLQPVWNTGFAASLLMTVALLNALFISAVYNDGQQPPPYGGVVRKLVTAAVLTLPVYAALASYALYLRVAQHGWSESRVTGALVCLVVWGYALSYFAAFLRRSDGSWVPRLAAANKLMATAMAVLAFLAYTPLLNPTRIAVSSQVERLLSNRVDVESFDFYYLRFQSGRIGEQALGRLAVLEEHPLAEAVRRRAAELEVMGEFGRRDPALDRSYDADDIAKLFPIQPAGILEPDFVSYVLANRSEPSLQACFESGVSCLLLAVNLDATGDEEYVLLRQAKSGYPYPSLPVFARSGGGWRLVTELNEAFCTDCDIAMEAARAGQVELLAPRWRVLKLGRQRFQAPEKTESDTDNE